ncbi:MAG TPA: acyl-CoA carboxylase subunit epsilon [Streptosporangiaceae bacterium]|nr:acyl-CoA carboxylase subunit epsilon [Streptosporangiaceae bacterium]
MSQSAAQPAAADAAQPAAADAPRPLLTIVRGEPTAAELAALTVVVSALARRGRQHPARERPRGSRWAAKDQMLRPQLSPGAGAWRGSALPR